MFALLLVLGFPGVARAERDEEPRAQSTTAPEKAPEQHFERALEEYRKGHYRAAIAELNEAIVLDPESKDLFYNLALVYEKLGELDRAIVALGRYVELEHDPAEAERASLTIARLRGAKEELAAERAKEQPTPPKSAQPIVVLRRLEPPPQEPEPGVDAWVVSGTALAAAAALVGVVFGARALALDAEATDARDRRRVDRHALVADIGLSVGVLAGAGTALLWFSRAGTDTSRQLQLSAPGLSLKGTF